jgi:hypothetical protein
MKKATRCRICNKPLSRFNDSDLCFVHRPDNDPEKQGGIFPQFNPEGKFMETYLFEKGINDTFIE